MPQCIRREVSNDTPFVSIGLLRRVLIRYWPIYSEYTSYRLSRITTGYHPYPLTELQYNLKTEVEDKLIFKLPRQWGYSVIWLRTKIVLICQYMAINPNPGGGPAATSFPGGIDTPLIPKVWGLVQIWKCTRKHIYIRYQSTFSTHPLISMALPPEVTLGQVSQVPLKRVMLDTTGHSNDTKRAIVVW